MDVQEALRTVDDLISLPEWESADELAERGRQVTEMLRAQLLRTREGVVSEADLRHTPGPWSHTWRDSKSGRIHYVIEGTEPHDDIRDVRDVMRQLAMLDYHGADLETEANADLMAAAPDLLSAIDGLLQVIDAYPLDPDASSCHIEAAFDAWERATGKKHAPLKCWGDDGPTDAADATFEEGGE